MTDEWHGWREATGAALYGPEGFYVRPGGPGPAGHFRTSVHASPLFASAVARLLTEVDDALGKPGELALVDIGAGRGELLTGVLTALPPELSARVRPYAVERAPRPADLDHRIEWRAEPPSGVSGLLFANEWLDNVPVDVAETDAEGAARYVLVRATDGEERLGDEVTGADAEWLTRWWPLGAGADAGMGVDAGAGAGPGQGPSQGYEADPAEAMGPGGGYEAEPAPPVGSAQWADAGLRAEIGRPRDLAWAAAVATLDAGLAVAVDYAHSRAARPPFGSLTGFRTGREVRPVPDGSCDITAHVALDACALPGAELLTQREALHRLGVTAARPPLALASTDPAAYVRALASTGEAAELTARGGLGDFGWLMQWVPFPPARPSNGGRSGGRP